MFLFASFIYCSAFRSKAVACLSFIHLNVRINFFPQNLKCESYLQGGPKVGIQYIVNYCTPTFGPPCTCSILRKMVKKSQNKEYMYHAEKVQTQFPLKCTERSDQMCLHFMKRNTLFLFQVQAAPYFYIQHIPGNVHGSKSRSKCYEAVPIPNSQKYYKAHSQGINALVLYAKCYTSFNI